MSETPDPVEHRPRPGGRSARVVHDVLDAVLAELAERGYALLSMEAVAQRAGVNKTTIYRRWPTKPELVLHALQELSIRSVAVPETGTVREDLIQTLRQLSTGMSSPLGRNLMVRLQVESTNEEVAAIGPSIAASFHARPTPSSSCSPSPEPSSTGSSGTAGPSPRTFSGASSTSCWRERDTEGEQGRGRSDVPLPAPGSDIGFASAEVSLASSSEKNAFERPVKSASVSAISCPIPYGRIAVSSARFIVAPAESSHESGLTGSHVPPSRRRGSSPGSLGKVCPHGTCSNSECQQL